MVSGPPSMSPMAPRMNPPRGPGMGPMGPGSYGPGMRGPPPNSSLGPGGPGPNPGMSPMSMAGPSGGRPQWQPNTSTVCNLMLISRLSLFLFHYLDFVFSSTCVFNAAYELFVIVTWKLRSK